MVGFDPCPPASHTCREKTQTHETVTKLYGAGGGQRPGEWDRRCHVNSEESGNAGKSPTGGME